MLPFLLMVERWSDRAPETRPCSVFKSERSALQPDQRRALAVIADVAHCRTRVRYRARRATRSNRGLVTPGSRRGASATTSRLARSFIRCSHSRRASPLPYFLMLFHPDFFTRNAGFPQRGIVGCLVVTWAPSKLNSDRTHARASIQLGARPTVYSSPAKSPDFRSRLVKESIGRCIKSVGATHRDRFSQRMRTRIPTHPQA